MMAAAALAADFASSESLSCVHAEIALILGDNSEIVKRGGDAALVAELSIDVEVLLIKRSRFVEIALRLCE